MNNNDITISRLVRLAMIGVTADAVKDRRAAKIWEMLADRLPLPDKGTPALIAMDLIPARTYSRVRDAAENTWQDY